MADLQHIPTSKVDIGWGSTGCGKVGTAGKAGGWDMNLVFIFQNVGIVWNVLSTVQKSERSAHLLLFNGRNASLRNSHVHNTQAQ